MRSFEANTYVILYLIDQLSAWECFLGHLSPSTVVKRLAALVLNKETFHLTRLHFKDPVVVSTIKGVTK